MRRLALALTVTALGLSAPPTATAHEPKIIGPVRLTIGWGEEPAFSGSKNFVEVAVADRAGRPIADLGGSLAVEVAFGTERIVLPLVPSDVPGDLRAPLVPTRPGTYSFHITGRVRGKAVDTTSTCSERTFDCVTAVSEIEFPTKDPSRGQLTQGLSRALSRAERARDTAATARRLAIIGIAVGALGLVVGAILGARKSGKRV